MMSFRFGGWKPCLYVGLLVTAGSGSFAAEPVLPLKVWDVDFNDNTLDAPPRSATKDEREAAASGNGWGGLPLRRYDALTDVTRTRVAVVRQSALGLKDRPVEFSFSESRQPHYGPRLFFEVPKEVAAKGARWKLSLDVAMSNVNRVGGIDVTDVCSLLFHEDGTLQANKVEVARYTASVPVHLDLEIDVLAHTVAVTVDGRSESKVVLPWRNPKPSQFSRMSLNGLLPGGHARAPGKMAFDNVRLDCLQWK